MLTIELMKRMWPAGDSKFPGLRQAIVDAAPAVFGRYGIDSPLLVAHLMAQLSEECGAGTEVVESLCYTTPERIRKVWPSRFPTVASAIPYLRSERKLADKVYNGRMGNAVGSDDGYNFRGRGPSQTTGREGYERLGRLLGVDLIGDPDWILRKENFLLAGVADYVACGCLPFARRDDIEGETHHLNGGLTNLAERKRWLARWKAALEVEAGAPAAAADGVLRYGASGYEVEALQRRLVELGYSVGRVDSQFGRATRTAVRAFQDDRALACSGEVDGATREALKRDLPKPVAEARANATAEDLKAAGSATVRTAEQVSWWGKLAGVVTFGGAGAHEGAQKLGLLSNVQETVDQVSTIRSLSDSVADLAGWAAQYWWVGVGVAGFIAWKFGHEIVEQRLADHRAGANMRL